MLDEPTFGVDAGAKHAIYQELGAAAAAGAAVVVSSSDTEELCELCDRTLVFGAGTITAQVDSPTTPDIRYAETLRASTASAANLAAGLTRVPC